MKTQFLYISKHQVLRRFLFAILLMSISLTGYSQDGIPPKPKNQTSVYDGAKILNNTEFKGLEQKLINYADSTSTQIVVITVPSTNGDDINLFAAEWGQKWGIGQKGKDNGVILMIALKDRKIAIQNGYGVESSLTDFLSKRIIDQIITPEFKRGNYYQGIDLGTTAIMQVLSGEFKETRQFNSKRDTQTKKFPFGSIIIFIIIFIILSRRNKGGGNGGGRRGFSILDALILTSLGSSGGGGFGGSSSGGGFGGGGFSGGFGGGGFGGGGASGGW